VTLEDFFIPLKPTLGYFNIKEVELGPFKHKIDEGAEIRNAGFCLLDSAINFKYVQKFETEIIEEILKNLGF
jgi:hypothetical protein